MQVTPQQLPPGDKVTPPVNVPPVDPTAPVTVEVSNYVTTVLIPDPSTGQLNKVGYGGSQAQCESLDAQYTVVSPCTIVTNPMTTNQGSLPSP